MIKNKYTVVDGVAHIEVKYKDERHTVLMDKEDLAHFDGHNITIFLKSGRDNKYPYVNRTLPDGRKMQYIHAIVIECPESKVIDHINGNRLDNRKVNLRIVTSSQNGMNKLIKPKNLYYNPASGIYYPRLKKEGKNIYGKGSKDIEEAERNAIEFRKEMFGEFA